LTAFPRALTDTDSNFAVNYTDWNEEGLPQGSLTGTYLSTDYNPRNYFFTFDEFTKLNLDVYLLKKTAAVTQKITIVDENGNGVSDALITIQKQINNTWTTVTQKKSTGSGTNFFLKASTKYKVVVTKTGYTQAVDYFYPQDFEEIIIQLASPGEYGFETLWDSVSYKLTPTGNQVPATVQPFNFSVYDSQGKLEEIGLNVSYNNTLLGSTTTSGSPSGAEVTATINLTNYTFGDEIKATWFFSRNSTDYSGYRIYVVNPELEPGDYSMLKTLENVKEDFGEAAVAIIAIFITLGVATAVGSRLGGLGGGIVVILTLGFFTYINWIQTEIFMITLIAAAGLYMLRS